MQSNQPLSAVQYLQHVLSTIRACLGFVLADSCIVVEVQFNTYQLPGHLADWAALPQICLLEHLPRIFMAQIAGAVDAGACRCQQRVRQAKNGEGWQSNKSASRGMLVVARDAARRECNGKWVAVEPAPVHWPVVPCAQPLAHQPAASSRLCG